MALPPDGILVSRKMFVAAPNCVMVIQLLDEKLVYVALATVEMHRTVLLGLAAEAVTTTQTLPGSMVSSGMCQNFSELQAF
jgi:hypothetical protein